MPLNDDPDAVNDEEYDALLTAAEQTAEPCPSAIPPDELDAALARLDKAGALGGAGSQRRD